MDEMKNRMNPDCGCLFQALEYLKMDEEIHTLQTIQENLESGTYFVALIGQYSSGKSSLINRLLDRDILPSGVTETTPLLTYIRYGEDERAELHYQNGSSEFIPIDEVKGIIQNNHDIKWDLLEYMEIFLKANVLGQGMVLLDTPGINTMIERHEALLSQSMDLASKIIYVCKGSPSRPDMDMLSSIKKRGFDPCFVRTHCDQILSREEDGSQAIAADIAILSKCGIAEKDCYHMSNEKQSPWYDNIIPLRDMMQHLGENAKDELKQASQNHTRYLAETCIGILQEKNEDLRIIKAGDDQEIQKHLNSLQEKIDSFEKIQRQRKNQLQRETESCQKEIQETVQQQIKRLLERSAKHIEEAGEDVRTSGQISQLMRSEALFVNEHIHSAINAAIAPIIQNVNEIDNMEEISLDFGGIPDLDSYAELVQEQDAESSRLIAQLENIKRSQQQLEASLQENENSPEYKALQEDLGNLEREIMEITKTAEGIPPYTPQFLEIQDGGVQPSEVTKKIGSMVDWMLLLLPGNVISSSVKGLAESEKVVKTAAKWIGKGEKIFKGGEKALKGIEQADKVKDTLFSFKTMQEYISDVRATGRRKATAQKTITSVGNVIERAEQNKASFLDLLTVQHWTEKLGKQFDRPPKLVIDEDYRAQYMAEKKKITDELRQRQERRYEKSCRLGLFETERARIEAQRRSLMVDEKEIQRELKSHEIEIRQRAEAEAYKQWKQKCSQWYLQQMESQLHRILKENIDSMPERLSRYQEKRLSMLQEKLEAKKKEYQSLKAQPKTKTEQELDRITSLLFQLKTQYGGQAQDELNKTGTAI